MRALVASKRGVKFVSSQRTVITTCRLVLSHVIRWKRWSTICVKAQKLSSAWQQREISRYERERQAGVTRLAVELTNLVVYCHHNNLIHINAWLKRCLILGILTREKVKAANSLCSYKRAGNALPGCCGGRASSNSGDDGARCTRFDPQPG